MPAVTASSRKASAAMRGLRNTSDRDRSGSNYKTGARRSGDGVHVTRALKNARPIVQHFFIVLRQLQIDIGYCPKRQKIENYIANIFIRKILILINANI